MSRAARHEWPHRPTPTAARANRRVPWCVAPIVVYQHVLISPALPRRCKYEPTCSRYALDAIREYGILRGAGARGCGGCSGATRGATADTIQSRPSECSRPGRAGSDQGGPWLQSRHPHRSFSPDHSRSDPPHYLVTDSLTRKRMPISANIIEEAFSPLISLFESIMVFIHAHLVGGSWGLAIVGLTVLMRAVLVPLTFKQLKSMQEMQRLAPQMKELKDKYKDDKQRQQQEIMKFYKENKINPLASCLPLALQLPVFISLFYMLRTDLKFDICGPQLREHYTRELHRPITTNSQIPEKAVHVMGHTVAGLTETGCNVVYPGSAKFLFIPDITAKATGVVLIVLIALYIASQIVSTLMATASADPNQRRMMLAAAAGDRRVPVPLPGRVCWCTGSRRTCGRSASSTSSAGASARRRRWPAREPAAGGLGALLGRKPDQPLGGAPRASRRWWAPAVAPTAPRRGATALAAQEEEALGPAAMSDEDSAELRQRAMRRGGVGAGRRRSKSCSRRSPTGWVSTSRSRCEEDDGVLRGSLRGEDVGLFIGRRGQTIDAVQHLAQRIVFPDGPSPVRVVIDADGYRERRAETLRADAERRRRRCCARASRSSWSRCRPRSGGSSTSTCASGAVSRPTARATSRERRLVVSPLDVDLTSGVPASGCVSREIELGRS